MKALQCDSSYNVCISLIELNCFQLRLSRENSVESLAIIQPRQLRGRNHTDGPATSADVKCVG